MTKILVTGATGLLGSTLLTVLKKAGYIVKTHALTSHADYQVDLTDVEATFKLMDEINPAIIINLTGQISVELCQDKPNTAYQANTKTVESLANWIESSAGGCHLVQISTDHLYDGTGPHTEDQVNLTNTYAFSKYAGELAAVRVPSTILRTNFVGRSKVSHRESLTDWVHTSLSNKAYVQVLNDVFFSPLSMMTLAKMICLVVEEKPIGIFNLGSHNGMSKADFDFHFAHCLNLQTDTMTRIDYKYATFLKAYRPKDMRLNCKKFEERFKIKLPDLLDEIKLAAEDYRE